MDDGRVTLNAGGRVFETTALTLKTSGAGYFEALLGETVHACAGSGSIGGALVDDAGEFTIGDVAYHPTIAPEGSRPLTMLSVSTLKTKGIGAYFPADELAYLKLPDGRRLALREYAGLYWLVFRPRLHSTALALHAALGDPRNRYADAKLLGTAALLGFMLSSVPRADVRRRRALLPHPAAVLAS